MENQRDIDLEKAIEHIRECAICQSEALQALADCTGWGMLLSETEYAWLIHIASTAVKKAKEL